MFCSIKGLFKKSQYLILGGLLAGALVGGLAGGTTGGVMACNGNRRLGDNYVIKYVPYHHPDG